MNSGCSAFDPGRLAHVGLIADDVVPPDVARRVHVDIAAGALVDDDVLDGVAAAHGEGLVDRRLERNLAAAAHLAVGRDDGHSARVHDPLLQALGGEAAEHHRVGGADAGAGLHRHHRLDAHGQVDDDAVAGLDAERLQAVGELTDAVIELLVGDLGDRAVVGLEDDGDLVGLGLEMPVQTVVGDVELAVVEPLEERGVALVQRVLKGLVPEHVLAREPGPEAGVVGLRLVAQGLIGGHAGHVGVLDEAPATAGTAGSHSTPIRSCSSTILLPRR